MSIHHPKTKINAHVDDSRKTENTVITRIDDDSFVVSGHQSKTDNLPLYAKLQKEGQDSEGHDVYRSEKAQNRRSRQARQDTTSPHETIKSVFRKTQPNPFRDSKGRIVQEDSNPCDISQRSTADFEPKYDWLKGIKAHPEQDTNDDDIPLDEQVPFEDMAFDEDEAPGGTLHHVVTVTGRYKVGVTFASGDEITKIKERLQFGESED